MVNPQTQAELGANKATWNDYDAIANHVRAPAKALPFVTVGSDAGCDYDDFADAVSNSVAGDTIMVVGTIPAHGIVWKDGLSLAGMSKYTSVLQLDANDYLLKSHSDPVANGVPLEKAMIGNLSFDGNKSNYATGKSLIYGSFRYCDFNDLYMINSHESTIKLTTTGNNYAYSNYLSKCRIESSDASALEVASVTDSHVTDCELAGCTGDIVKLTSCAGWSFNGGIVGNTSENDFNLISSATISIGAGLQCNGALKSQILATNSSFIHANDVAFLIEGGDFTNNNTYSSVTIDNSFFCNVVFCSWKQRAGEQKNYLVKEVAGANLYSNAVVYNTGDDAFCTSGKSYKITGAYDISTPNINGTVE